MKKIFLFLLFSAAITWAQPQSEDLAILPPQDDGSMIDNMMPPQGQDELLPPGDEMMRTGFDGGRIIEELKLTSEQEKQFGKLESEMQKAQIDLRSQMQSMRIDLRDLFREDNPDQRKIESKLDEIDKLQTKTRKNHLDFWFNVNRMLTPDQQKIWKQHRMMMGEGMRMRDGHGMRGGDDRRSNAHGRGEWHQQNMQECRKAPK
jgi:Spy/CpxP family protein refolding chaperone